MTDSIARKYRDEPRPRQGLLRTREFLMKDLYTFDLTKEMALESYETVRKAYNAFFDEFKIPYLIAEADSGDIGGDLSHEYHLPTSKGEDNILSCDSCSLVANEEEVAKLQEQSRTRTESTEGKANGFSSWYGISRDRTYLVEAIYPANIGLRQNPQINPFVMKRLFPDLDLSVEDALKTFARFWIGAQATETRTMPKILQISDYRVPLSQLTESTQAVSAKLSRLGLLIPKLAHLSADTNEAPDLLRLQNGSSCPKCTIGTLKTQNAIELGHTFYLGTKYSVPLGANVFLDRANPKVPVQMGCHGIGVSRLIGAVADSLADKVGLNWPRVMAPFEVVIISHDEHAEAAAEIYDFLTAGDGKWFEFTSANGNRTVGAFMSAPTPETPAIDAVMDDRYRSPVWKLKDADLIGFPVIVALRQKWGTERKVEVQCRRLGYKEEIEVANVRETVEGLLKGERYPVSKS